MAAIMADNLPYLVLSTGYPGAECGKSGERKRKILKSEFNDIRL